jgi:hypothetical protein
MILGGGSKMKTTISIILLVLLCITPVMALTYPKEYYTNDIYISSVNDYVLNSTYLMSTLKEENTTEIQKQIRDLNIATFLGIRNQNILLEKQNELQNELVKAQWVEICYRPMYGGWGNYSAWQSECAKAGYPVGDYG